MRKSAFKLLAILFVAAVPLSGQAASVTVVEGGTTSVLFGNGALDALGLGIKGVDGTIVPGNLGPFSVAFGITGRDVDTLPTTFSYDAGDFLGSFAGTIEHSGTIELTDAATGSASITVGNFTIGFDAGRSDDTRSGFFVQDNVDTGAILFDIGNPIVEAFDTSLVIAADILVSQELSDTLNALELIDFDATGVDGGMALVIANGSIIPVPAAVWLFASALGLLGWVRRRV